MTTIGSLFSGYCGLDCGVQQVIPADVIWHSDIKPAAVKLLAYHWPHVPNLGDITAIDWSEVERPDIVTMGFPCTDISAAGQQAGLIRRGANKTRSGLWAEACRAIDELRPSLVVAENVRAITSVKADSDVEPCPWCLGDGDTEPHLRALGAVLADLADIGFDAAWYGMRASEVGAPHGRFRIFIIAWPAPDANGTTGRPEQPRGLTSGSTKGAVLEAKRGTGRDSDTRPDAKPAGSGWTGVDDRAGEQGARGSGQRVVGGSAGLRAPADTGCEHGQRRANAVSGGVGERRPSGQPERSAAAVADPSGEGLEGRRAERGRRETPLATDSGSTQWGIYGPAVRRWGAVLGRPAPPPTETGPNGGQRLSAYLTEWMMGLPLGHVTGVPGLSRNDMLSLCGDGVVPQQAAAALRYLLAATESVRAA